MDGAICSIRDSAVGCKQNISRLVLFDVLWSTSEHYLEDTVNHDATYIAMLVTSHQLLQLWLVSGALSWSPKHKSSPPQMEK